MSKPGKCGRCGRDPAEGFASVWTPESGETWFCHGDDDESPTCYERNDSLQRFIEDEALAAEQAEVWDA